jgi:hypothetical protein
MNIIQNAAGQPAGAGTLHVETSQIIALITAGQLAVDLCRAERSATELREIYLLKLREYENRFGPVDGRLNPTNPAHVGIIEYTHDRRAAYLASKAKIYNIKRRMRAACLKISRSAAAGGGAA